MAKSVRMPPPPPPNWSPQHEDARKALVGGLGFENEQATNLLGRFPAQANSDDLLNLAWQSHLAARKAAIGQTQMPAGAPKNAVTLHDPRTVQPPKNAPPLPVQPSGPVPAPLSPATAQTRPQGQKSSFADWLRYGPGYDRPQEKISAPIAKTQEPTLPTEAPAPELERVSEVPPAIKQAPGQLSPAAATFLAKLNLTPSETARARQLPGPGAAKALPAPAEKPRIRVRATGQRIPPAPLGPATESEKTTQAERAIGTQPSLRGERPTAPEMPAISTEEEYNKLEPGTLFRWTDGRLYRAHLNKP